VVRLINKDQTPVVDDPGKESLNFQISVTIHMIVSLLLVLVLIGILKTIRKGASDGPLSLWERVRVRGFREQTCDFLAELYDGPHPLPLSQRARGAFRIASYWRSRWRSSVW
jgi:hypothetical protein